MNVKLMKVKVNKHGDGHGWTSIFRFTGFSFGAIVLRSSRVSMTGAEARVTGAVTVAGVDGA